MISREDLRSAFLSPQMMYYFHKKLAPLAPAVVDARIEEVLKFLNLAAHSPGAIPVSKEIDDVWHYWVLETAEYEALCRKLPGGRFLHHSSNEYAEFHDPRAKEKEIDPVVQISYLGSYVKSYGPFERDRVGYWPFALRLMEMFGWSLDELNARLLACTAPARTETDELTGLPG
jgi:hypothetical protein